MFKTKFIAFGRTAVLFFAISHILSYILSTFQTALIIKEVRKK